MRNKLVIIIFLLFVKLHSQVNNNFVPKVNNLPTSPEASLFQKFSDIQPGSYTGAFSFSIPLHNITYDNVTIPIEIKYHGSGIKVDEQATWVGLGWDLTIGGAIIQEIRGKEDYLDNNLNMNNFPQDYQIFKSHLGPINSGAYYIIGQTGDCGTSSSCNALGYCIPGDDSVYIINDLLQGEAQPDIYNFNFGKFSGKFFIEPETGNIVFLENNEDKIKFIKSGQGWIAKTSDGVVYNFQTVEISNTSLVSEYVGKTYRLSNIVFPDHSQISFEYTDEKYTYIDSNQSYYFGVPIELGEYPLKAGYNFTQFFKKTITKIETLDQIVNFNLEGREDINLDYTNNTKRLKSIDIISKINGKKIKSYEFSYSYFPYNLDGIPSSNGIYSIDFSNIDVYGKRLKLESVQEIGYDANENKDFSINPYQFEYDLNHTLPIKKSNSKDFFGFYNGSNNQSLLPDLDYFEFQTDPKYIGLSISSFNYPYEKNNRFPNDNYCSTYLLNKITYPTKGYSIIEYESNTFSNYYFPNQTKLNQAKKNITIVDNNTSNNNTHFFQINKSTTIQFTNEINNGFTPYNTNFTPYTFNQMQGSYIKLLKYEMTQGAPIVTVLKEWLLNNYNSALFTSENKAVWNESYFLEYDSNPNVQYAVSVYLPNNLLNNTFNAVQVKSNFRFYNNLGIDTSISYGGGARLKKITNYTSNNIFSNQKIYEYSNGKLLSDFNPLESYDVYYTKCVSSVNHDSFGVAADPRKRISISTDDFGFNGGNLIGYSEVVEKEVNTHLETNGSILKKFYNEKNFTYKNCPSIINPKNGLLIEESIFNKNGQKLRDKIINYSDIKEVENYFGIKINSRIIGNTDLIDENSLSYANSNYSYPNFRTKYFYTIYPIVSRWIKPESTETIEYFGNEEIKTKVEYTYNSEGNKKTEVITNPNNDIQITEYYYPKEINNVINQSLVAHNMNGNVVKTETSKNGEVISTKEIQFGYFNSLFFKPFEIFTSKGLNSLKKEVSIINYDNYSNILEYKIENDISVCFVWGYNNTLPIAKIVGVSYSSIPSSLITNLKYLSDNDIDSNSELNLKNGLHVLYNLFPNAFITTYTYDPLIGVTSITDSNNISLYYKYNSNGKLTQVTDHHGNIVTENSYNYRP